MNNSSTTRSFNPCLVCGDKSIGFNFGVLSCMACKAFFRRNAVRLGTYDFTCPKDGDCSITHTFRRICNCCRLAKCFRVGMRKDLILSEAEKEARRKTVAKNRQKREQVLKTQCLDMVPVSTIQYFTPHQLTYLSQSDRILLGNVFNTYETTCIAARNSHLPEFPTKKHTNLCDFLNEYSLMHKVLIDYFKVIPEFNTLAIDDKICLIRNQFGVVNNINEAIVHPGISNNLIVSSSNVYGTYITNRLIKSIQRIAPFTNDPIILKLLLLVVAFSSGNCRNRNDTEMDQICNDTLSIYFAQNIYTELLWKYVLSRSSTEIDAVKFFDKLVQFLLYLLDVHLLIDGYINGLYFEIEQMEPLMQSMWPKPIKRDSSLMSGMDVESD
ncbi:unnamed protein product [Rotaria socialis]|uniref:Nuclear receptor domain-containing protein n=1 Tax=Rotaria socialis TaxID=392032 RepID=A0A818S1R0_9BILA|nr:unnamed protein product [Rotaria socialis]CAF3666509.1 unnamed protein product [Rotaria socialis]CAF4427993.1 unnamed protein product [Rotaria socialis]CAF4761831.1 unnamed protein product [Rotaria socialis]